MKLSKQNLVDTVTFYMQDNDVDYLHIRASQSMDRSEIIMVINDDIELEDDD
jgi:hypothetical protein